MNKKLLPDLHHESCGCGHDHDHHDHTHHHHEHHSHEHHHDDVCNCGCEHTHEHGHDEECCCGHNHEHSHNHVHHFDDIRPEAQKIYIINNLGCANCAAKMEQKIQKLPQVKAASITFATKQLRIAADDPDAIFPQIESICQSIEDNVNLTEKKGVSEYHTHENDDKSFFRHNTSDLISITAGAALFAFGIVSEHMESLSHFTFFLFITAYAVLGWKVLWTSLKNISKGQIFDENFLMSIATIAAFFIGEFAEGVGVMLFYRIGEFFEHIAVEKSRSQIMDAVDMRPETVNIVRDHEISVIPAEEAAAGDIVLIRPGDRIPLDGIIIDGESRLDTSPITGEPVPVHVSPGVEVISGCVNENGLLKMQVVTPLCGSMVTRILDSVENAAAGKPQIDKFITKFAKIYTPIVVILAVLTAIIPSLFTGNWNFWITTAITFLVISCPCAMVISVPLAFFAGIGTASKFGILFKGGIAIEALRKIKAVIMDKTGTITKGNFAVQNITSISDITENQLLSIAASCESHSTHPIAVSITEEAKNRGITIMKPDSLEELSGMGIIAQLSADKVLCGNKALMDKYHIDLSPYEKMTGTEVFIAVNGTFAGSVNIADTIKDDAITAVSKIKNKGLLTVMLTGDTCSSANAVAEKTGISRVYAQLMPDDKLRILKELREEVGSVMFVGDGINDAPVLAGADVGAAMGSGADAAIEAADVVFMNSSVEAISQAVNIADSTCRIATQNVVFALAVKLIVLLLGFLGFANIWAAVFADTGVAMLCILNSLRLLLAHRSES